MRTTVTLLALALLALPLTGCLGGDEVPAERTVMAGSGRVSPGWAYDGAGLEGGDATLQGTIHNPENRGAVYANFTYKGQKWAVVFDQFTQAEGKTFMDGGVAFELDEHGDTQVADASIPKIHAKIAAWGSATVTVDGKPAPTKTPGAWSAHLMVFDDAVRGPDGKITKADGATPYDPSTPADGKTYPGQKQALLKLVSPDGETGGRAPAHVDKNATIQGPNAVQTVEIPFEPGVLPFTINVTSTSLAPPEAPAPVGAGTIAIAVKIGDKTVGTDAGNVQPGTAYAKAFEIKAEDLAGANATAVKVEITGSGAYGVNVVTDLVYADTPLLVVTWDNPTIA